MYILVYVYKQSGNPPPPYSLHLSPSAGACTHPPNQVRYMSYIGVRLVWERTAGEVGKAGDFRGGGRSTIIDSIGVKYAKTASSNPLQNCTYILYVTLMLELGIIDYLRRLFDIELCMYIVYM
jgi:hypothetical protein